ncbi:diguanylate cyclase [Acidovorax sp. Be4]|uniref:diguanylate cyclase n=1 Tax=Acidovorax bellezanensis TaxID=2976702 RepID=A0ABT2PIH0_9BURK|nr:diguanylate cyclase [Acidovorax sp. Be4]MCT9810269.1 diguanylate cyclase [Acidovorax sp. Be4]
MTTPADEHPTILVVDDERLNRAALAELLGQEYRVLLAKDGPSALAHAQREAQQLLLILLDVSMPGMSGYEVLRALRADERTAGIAVIFITGQSDDAAEEYGLSLGAADYVSKPVRPAIVRVRVRNQIHLAQQKRTLERLAQIDGLTGLANRRHFDDMLDRAHRRSRRTGSPLGLALIDIDHFKQYNDRYGHIQGDEALKAVARTLQAHARRPDDLAARFGGEEFALLVPGDEGLLQRMEDFRLAVLAQAIEHADSSTGPALTVSCGLVVAQHLEHLNTTDLLQKADSLLYTAKSQGRNRTSVWLQS